VVDERKEELRRHGCFVVPVMIFLIAGRVIGPKIRCASACSWAFVGDTGERLTVLDLGGTEKR
jgi:hypothetical protein